ncbi:hypothetical protein PGH07_00115 [Sulfurovum sp. zt1-1]|uniref:LTXXQ motif family protein n=1 Tax=Sulfurovum zhangzhouensis TaxID=3019067 RepID=A0ABT7QUS2_9BACT|nr:hypothetical protein [Sulfurovum zhangzhouensis]MDM5270580.1 hypothetical protein [Sulfurovum zhangzhouensis]
MKYLWIVLLLFTFLFADDHKEEHHHYYSKDLTYLNLSHEQQRSIKKVLKEYRKELKMYRELKENTIGSKQKLFEQERFDQNALITLDIKLAQKAAQIEANFLTNIHTILTKEQRKLFIKHIDEWEIE